MALPDVDATRSPLIRTTGARVLPPFPCAAAAAACAGINSAGVRTEVTSVMDDEMYEEEQILAGNFRGRHEYFKRSRIQ